MIPVALTIAGSDPSGGAGIQADLKTFHQHGVYGEAVVTLLTVQNTVRVARVEILAASFVAEQLQAVLEDIPPAAVKTGALGSAEIIEAVASLPFSGPLVVDPVLISKHGAPLATGEVVEAYRRHLIPRATLITPNLAEAGRLLDREVQSLAAMRESARQLLDLGCQAALVKGGHLAAEPVDVLCSSEGLQELHAPRIATRNTHGTGCTYSAAITANLALGLPLAEAIGRAKRFITRALQTAPALGGGFGPVNHFVSP